MKSVIQYFFSIAILFGIICTVNNIHRVRELFIDERIVNIIQCKGAIRVVGI